MHPELLTAGPRGRRLCLNLATALDDLLSRAVFDRSYDLDPGKGTSVKRLMAFAPGTTQAEMDAARAAEEARPVPTVADVARLLVQVDLPAAGPAPAQITPALAESVSTAMYWQPPHGEDVLAGHRELDDGLARVATWLAPQIPDWWTTPMAPEQWVVAWWGHDPRKRKAPALTKWRKQTLAEEHRAATLRRKNRVEYPKEGWSPTPGLRPADVTASISGTWWSFPDGVATTRAVDGVPAGLDLTEDAGDDQARAFEVRVPTDARVLEIDHPQVWIDLCRAHSLEVTSSRRHDWYRVTGRDGDWVIPDWAAVAESYDAVHLTTAAYLAGATRALEVNERLATMIAGWGPDATVWLTPVRAGTPHVWSFDGEADRWSVS
ncbi:MAG TPA: hypothetical protein H9815_07055 [Candidatus Ruania gallistercoris]|uniref:Uncharacterized protein n=1 Tax=Candidatus Ruania gallistercoris TaxID=2838746 RepID=A0A9D2EDV8_9MICO|nr:hypothetical protein [Candidatus Ruania gallistercoris]